MRRRWTRVASVACLILVILGIGSRGLAREIGGKHSTHAKREDQKRPPQESAFKVVAVGLDRCKSKKIDACSRNIRAKKNDSLIDDDKRAVPTGPNPLHNR